MKEYEINYLEVQERSQEENLATLEAAVRFANYRISQGLYVAFDEIFAILGIFPRDYEVDKQMTQDDVEEILFGKKSKDD